MEYSRIVLDSNMAVALMPIILSWPLTSLLRTPPRPSQACDARVINITPSPQFWLSGKALTFWAYFVFARRLACISSYALAPTERNIAIRNRHLGCFNNLLSTVRTTSGGIWPLAESSADFFLDLGPSPMPSADEVTQIFHYSHVIDLL